MEKFFSQKLLQKILLLFVLLTFSGCEMIRSGFTFQYSLPDVETADTGGGDDGGGTEEPEKSGLEAWVELVGGKTGTGTRDYVINTFRFSDDGETLYYSSTLNTGNVETYSLTDNTATANSAIYSGQIGFYTYTITFSEVTSESAIALALNVNSGNSTTHYITFR